MGQSIIDNYSPGDTIFLNLSAAESIEGEFVSCTPDRFLVTLRGGGKEYAVATRSIVYHCKRVAPKAG